MKKCLRCGKLKPSSEFHKRKSQKDGLYYYCKSCVYEYNHSDTAKRSNKKYKKTHPLSKDEQVQQREYLKKYYQDNKARLRNAHQTWLESPENKQLNNQLKLKYKKTDKGKETEKRYRQSETGKATLRKNSAIRRAGGDISTSEWKEIVSRAGMHCPLCRKIVFRFHMDHWIPVTKGGKTIKGNLLPLCKKCNQKKGNKEPIKFVVATFGKDALARALAILQG